MCRRGLGGFLRELGLVDELLEIRKGDRASYAQAREQAGAVDLVLSPHSSFRTALWVWRLGAREQVGFRNLWSRWAYSKTVERDVKLPDAIRQMQLLTPFDSELAARVTEFKAAAVATVANAEGRLSPVPSWASMSLGSKYDAHQDTWTKLAERTGLAADHRPLVLVFPGSVWATKRWTLASYAKVANDLQAKGARIVVMGGPGEESIAAELAALVPGSLDLAAKTTLMESALILRHAALTIGNDSASAHLAATTETPTIAIFGPTVLEFGFRPWQDRAWVVQREGLFCRPCGPHGHHQCPRGTHECMTDLPPATVSQLGSQILGSR